MASTTQLRRTFSQLNSKFNFKVIFLFGAPGTGKGTYGGLLSKDLNVKKISTGDEIRRLTKQKNISDDLKEIKERVSKGKFISDKMA